MKKRLFSIVLLACAAVCHVLQLSAAPVAMSFVKSPRPDIDNDDKSPFGSRIPSRPLTITIDFDKEEIILPQEIGDVECYEIRTDDLSAVLYFSSDQKEFVSTLATFTSPVAVVITTGTYILTGYLEF